MYVQYNNWVIIRHVHVHVYTLRTFVYTKNHMCTCTHSSEKKCTCIYIKHCKLWHSLSPDQLQHQTWYQNLQKRIMQLEMHN